MDTIFINTILKKFFGTTQSMYLRVTKRDILSKERTQTHWGYNEYRQWNTLCILSFIGCHSSVRHVSVQFQMVFIVSSIIQATGCWTLVLKPHHMLQCHFTYWYPCNSMSLIFKHMLHNMATPTSLKRNVCAPVRHRDKARWRTSPPNFYHHK
jgi:hypothetical protein